MRFLCRRLAFYLMTAWAAITLNFVIPRLMPGNPISGLLARFQGQIGEGSGTQLQAFRVLFGLNRHSNVLVEYGQYLDDVLHLRFGLSFTFFPTPVATVIRESLPWTVVMVGTAATIAWFLGTLLGVIAGWRRGGRWDAVVPTSAFLRGIPAFWIGLLVVLLFAVKLDALPVSGAYSPNLVPSFSLSFIGSAVVHAIGPALSIVIGSIAGHMLTMRNMMVSTISEDYLLTAEAKGLSNRTIMLAYAARNAVIPSVVNYALELGFVVSGALLVEEVFSYPGIGYILFEAIESNDYPLIEAIFLVITLAVLVANAASDVVVLIVDPRTREGS